MMFSHDGQRLIVRQPGSWLVLRRPDYEVEFEWDVGDAPALLDVAPDDRFVAVAMTPTDVEIFRLDVGRSATRLTLPESDSVASGEGTKSEERLLQLAVPPDGQQVVVVTSHGIAHAWNLHWLDEHLLPLLNDWQPITSYRGPPVLTAGPSPESRRP